MITKILDNYYTNKLKEFINNEFLTWNLDLKFQKDGEFIDVCIKKRIYDEKMYRRIFYFSKEMAFYWLCKQDELEKLIDERINIYCKECENE